MEFLLSGVLPLGEAPHCPRTVLGFSFQSAGVFNKRHSCSLSLNVLTEDHLSQLNPTEALRTRAECSQILGQNVTPMAPNPAHDKVKIFSPCPF